MSRFFLFVAVFVIAVLASSVHAHDSGQWDNSDPVIREWYQALKQPDIPTASCCGEADAYWCDDYYARDGRAFCRITDDRPDAPRHRPHVDVGTEIEIPPNKLKHDSGNPTGHGVVFLSRQGVCVLLRAAGRGLR